MVKVQMASTYCASAAGGLYNCRKNIYKTVCFFILKEVFIKN